jgi:hypothetical protein
MAVIAVAAPLLSPDAGFRPDLVAGTLLDRLVLLNGIPPGAEKDFYLIDQELNGAYFQDVRLEKVCGLCLV